MRAMDCADYIVDRAISKDLNITNLQLQKALYVFAAEYIRITDNYPYGEDNILAWKYGPAIYDVYKEYSRYGSLNIKEVSNHRKFNPNTKKFESNMYDNHSIDDDYKGIVNDNLERYLSKNIFDIVEFTHAQDFWRNNRRSIYQQDNIIYPYNQITLNKSISEFLKEV